MPRKRRIGKRGSLMVSERAREIWRSGRSEMVCLTPEGAGLICDDELAAELGVPVLVMLPNAKALVERLE
ncbi:hypothetical protein OAN58_03805 [Paracoccaceae bacterium]|nr:hypothetical protein [Paracoccaceae bacterium]